MPTAPVRNSRVRQAFNRMAVIGVVLLGMLGFAADPAMAATSAPTSMNVHTAALPLQSVRTVSYGWAGKVYYFDRDETKNISAGAGFLVGWKIGGPVLGTMVAMANQQAQNAVDHGQCLRVRTWGIFSVTPSWSYYSC